MGCRCCTGPPVVLTEKQVVLTSVPRSTDRKGRGTDVSTTSVPRQYYLDLDGMSALHWAAQVGNTQSIATLVKEFGADVNVKNTQCAVCNTGPHTVCSFFDTVCADTHTVFSFMRYLHTLSA
eukprot:1946206-Rhodomonas_salina.1